VQPEVAVSTNAACSAGSLHASHVLLAIGLSEESANSCVRIGFGRFNTLRDVEIAAQYLADTALRIRHNESDIPVRSAVFA
jgi:cysteine desulfurase